MQKRREGEIKDGSLFLFLCSPEEEIESAEEDEERRRGEGEQIVFCLGD